MITKKDILKMVKHVSRRSQRLPDKRIIHPKREWMFGVVGFFIILIVGGVFSASRFTYYSNIDNELQTADVEVINYKEGSMAEVLKFFDTQILRFQQLRNGLAPVPIEEVDTPEVEHGLSTEKSEEGSQDINQPEEETITKEVEAPQVPAEENVGDEESESEVPGGLDAE